MGDYGHDVDFVRRDCHSRFDAFLLRGAAMSFWPEHGANAQVALTGRASGSDALGEFELGALVPAKPPWCCFLVSRHP